MNLKGVILRLGKDESKIGMLDLTKSVRLPRVNLKGADLRNADLEGVDLSRADLSEVRFQFAKLVSANLSKAILVNANLTQADLRKADLSGANFTNAVVQESRWYMADVERAHYQLKTANFKYIVVEDQKQKKWYRNDLFFEEEKNVFFL